MDNSRLLPALLIGAVLAAAGIGLFVAFYLLFAGLDELPRVVLALCLPPAFIGLAVGGYALVRGRRAS